jgi:hypothetical protein
MRCPYCDTPNNEGADVCRHCGQELPAGPGPWRGPDETVGPSAANNVKSAHDEWDPARRFSGPRTMSKFVAPARYPNHLGWAITSLVLCFLIPIAITYILWGWLIAGIVLGLSPVAIVALLCSLQVKRKHAIGDDERAFRFSQLAKLWCWISILLGFAIYVGVFMRLMYGIGHFWGY